MTRCKAGDLALVLKAKKPERVGTVVRVLSLSPTSVTARKAVWTIDPLNGAVPAPPGKFFTALDKNLMPLRDTDKPDETLSWTPVPTKETT